MSNRRDPATLEISISDLPMLAHAVSIGRSTAYMCGHKMASERMARLLHLIRAQIPEAATIFDEYVFCDLCAHLAETPTWTVELRGWPSAWRSEGQIVVSIGTKEFVSEKSNYKEGCETLATVKGFLEEMAPSAEECAHRLANPIPTPITPGRAKKILEEADENPGRDIFCFMEKDEEHIVREAWLRQPDGRFSMRSYLVSIATQALNARHKD